MKSIVFPIVFILTLIVHGSSNANTLTIINNTPCYFIVVTQNSGAGGLIIPPGSTILPNDTDDYTLAKVSWSGGGSNLDVWYGGPTFANSSTIGVFPTCFSTPGTAFNISWSQSSPTSNAVLVIF